MTIASPKLPVAGSPVRLKATAPTCPGLRDNASARITTEKGAALDTFYLCDSHGKKIESEEQLRRLTKEVRSRIVP